MPIDPFLLSSSFMKIFASCSTKLRLKASFVDHFHLLLANIITRQLCDDVVGTAMMVPIVRWPNEIFHAKTPPFYCLYLPCVALFVIIESHGIHVVENNCNSLHRTRGHVLPHWYNDSISLTFMSWCRPVILAPTLFKIVRIVFCMESDF